MKTLLGSLGLLLALPLVLGGCGGDNKGGTGGPRGGAGTLTPGTMTPGTMTPGTGTPPTGAAAQLVGIWGMRDTEQTGEYWEFYNDGKYELITYQITGTNAARAQLIGGYSFTLNGSQLTLGVDVATCNWKRGSSSFTAAVSGNSLTLTTSTGQQVVYTKGNVPTKPDNVTYGCIDETGMTFTPMEPRELSN